MGSERTQARNGNADTDSKTGDKLADNMFVILNCSGYGNEKLYFTALWTNKQVEGIFIDKKFKKIAKGSPSRSFMKFVIAGKQHWNSTS